MINPILSFNWTNYKLILCCSRSFHHADKKCICSKDERDSSAFTEITYSVYLLGSSEYLQNLVSKEKPGGPIFPLSTHINHRKSSQRFNHNCTSEMSQDGWTFYSDEVGIIQYKMLQSNQAKEELIPILPKSRIINSLINKNFIYHTQSYRQSSEFKWRILKLITGLMSSEENWVYFRPDRISLLFGFKQLQSPRKNFFDVFLVAKGDRWKSEKEEVKGYIAAEIGFFCNRENFSIRFVK